MKITQTLYLHQDAFGGHSVCQSDMTGKKYFEGYVLLTKQEVTFDVPDDINIVALKVQALDRQLDSVHTEYSAAIRRLEDKKATLLCIENAVAA